ncbi:MAG: alpha-L-fucosidase [Clostridia bacterium]|nr:alpha-L-fucosidase [Clostridia bacterium]MBQ7348262.1 alpha-L-fucosidase [Clostridia bacterium]
MENNKFGMFIHWGIYALTGVQEQVIARNDMSHEEYDKLVGQFNPTEYDPEEWVLLAKNAGMKYICFTTKHHDGFCMWDTKYTDYNVMNTPYGKDVLKMLADACRKHGMKLSLYYSNPDWHHENGYNSYSTHQWKAVNPSAGDREKYRAYVKNQVRELLTNYGEIYTFFWDIPPKYIDQSMNELIRELQPGIFINNRGYDDGDFETPEREVPEGNRFVRMTEACESVGEQSWGYRENEDYFSIRYLTSSICKIMAMGGSYLLNVGPMANGKIDEKSASIIKRVGDWYCRMNGVLEGHEKDPLGLTTKGKDPFVAFRKNEKTYLCYYAGSSSSAINFVNAPSVPKCARLLNGGETLGLRYETLPAYIWGGRAAGPFVSITGIPVDDYPAEPLVIEIEW